MSNDGRMKFLLFTLIPCCVTLVLLSTPAFSQAASEFTNLQVLDSNITRPELIGKMKDISIALGVRCEYCHAENTANSNEHFNFASDEKEPKKIARKMMLMTNYINQSYLAEFADGGQSPEVSCFTCHHGHNKPMRIESEFERALASGGIDSAFTVYGTLKEQFYGASILDFTEKPLNRIAMTLVQQGKSDDAIAVLTFNEKQHPESVEVKEMFALVYFQTGRTQEAKDAAAKVLEIVPDNGRMKSILNRIDGQ